MKLNRKNFAELFRTDYYTVSVHFAVDDRKYAVNDTKAYTYKVSKDMEVKEGDDLLVYVASRGQPIHALKVVRVVSVNREAEIEEDSPFDYKWIVAKLDDVMASYYANLEKDNNLKRAVYKLEAALEKVSLRKQLEAAMQELDEEDKKELAAAFNMTNLLGNDKKETEA